MPHYYSLLTLAILSVVIFAAPTPEPEVESPELVTRAVCKSGHIRAQCYEDCNKCPSVATGFHILYYNDLDEPNIQIGTTPFMYDARSVLSFCDNAHIDVPASQHPFTPNERIQLKSIHSGVGTQFGQAVIYANINPGTHFEITNGKVGTLGDIYHWYVCREKVGTTLTGSLRLWHGVKGSGEYPTNEDCCRVWLTFA